MTTEQPIEEHEKALFKDGESVEATDFLSTNEANTQKIKRMTETLYSCERRQEPVRTATMRTLLTDPKYYNDEQIWSQIKLFSDPLLNYVESEISDLTKSLSQPEYNEEEEEDENENSENTDSDDKETTEALENDEENGMEEEEEEDNNEESKDNDNDDDEFYDELYGNKAEEDEDEDESVTYKDFYGDAPKKGEFDSLEFPEMDEDGEFIQLKSKRSDSDSEEKEEEEEEEGDGDEFDQMDRDLEEQEEMDAMEKENNNNEEEEEEEEDDENKKKTPHELELERIGKKIAKLEDENVGEKDWSMMGEVSKFDRPENSLLDAYVEFQTANKAAPEVSPEVTEELNELIQNRIRNSLFDDVIPKAARDLPNAARFGTKIMSLEEQEKMSKMGLAEVYEQEYRSKMLAGQDAKNATSADDVSADDKLTPMQKAVQDDFRKICFKLDRLTNFHYTPKPVSSEIKVLPNVAAIRVEEKVPISVNRASLLAPEEIFAQKQAAPLSKDEMSREEKHSAHAAAKRDKRKKLQDSGVAAKRRKEEEVKKASGASAVSAAAKLKMDTIAVQQNKEIDNRKTKSFGSKKFFTDLQNKQQDPRSGVKKSAHNNNNNNNSTNSYSSTSMSSKL